MDEDGDDGTKVMQKISFLSPELLSLVDWFFHKAANGSRPAYEASVKETVRQVNEDCLSSLNDNTHGSSLGACRHFLKQFCGSIVLQGHDRSCWLACKSTLLLYIRTIMLTLQVAAMQMVQRCWLPWDSMAHSRLPRLLSPLLSAGRPLLRLKAK